MLFRTHKYLLESNREVYMERRVHHLTLAHENTVII